jgi:stress response protein SCP2
MNVEQLVFSARHRVCTEEGAAGDGTTVARQLDAVLMTIGYKLSGRLLVELGALEPGLVTDKAVDVIGWARQESGAHREHNAYFIDFPANVPDTREFWQGLLRDAVMAATRGEDVDIRVAFDASGPSALDLLSLPGYGTYQHYYEQMVAHHESFEALLRDRLTILHAGADADTEGRALFADLAGSAVPLTGDKLEELRFLAQGFAPSPLPKDIPVRENLAVVNAARARLGAAPRVSTVTDVLRIAAELSGADVTLQAPPKFKSFSRRTRHALLDALDVVAADPARLEDVPLRAELWKRLGERLHPHEFPQYPAARHLFEVARGEVTVRNRASRAEHEFAAGRVDRASRELQGAPGEYFRSLDRMLIVVNRAAQVAPHVSGRVLLSTRQHLMNRAAPGSSRIFANRKGRAWVEPDKREPLDEGLIRELNGVIDAEIASRHLHGATVVCDPAVLGAALPLSGKNQSQGLGVWPRGSVSKLAAGEWLRFFFYWKQAARRTDYDLSCLFVDEQFRSGSFISYSELRGRYGEHSGDITDAPNGATEFINVHLDHVPKGTTVIPQLYLFNGSGSYDNGETFDEVEENFFGYMTRSPEQKGLPFEPRTVRMKTVLAGEHRAVMPVVFFRGDDGAWYAKWLHLGLRSQMSAWGGNRVEENKATTELLARHYMATQFLTVRYLRDALAQDNTVVSQDKGGAWREQLAGPVTYIGIEEPEGLPEGSAVYTLANLGELVPA